MFMLATSASRDLYGSFVNRQASDAGILRAARISAVIGAVAGVALALFVHGSVTSAIRVFYAILTVTLFVPVVAALHTPVRARDGLAAVAGGIATLIVVETMTAGRGYGIVTPTLAGVLVSLAAFAASKTTFRTHPASI